MANPSFFESYEEEFFGLDIESFDLSFSHPVPEHGIDGQSLFTDGSGRIGWGGLSYNLIHSDDFDLTTINRELWNKIGAGTENTVFRTGWLRLTNGGVATWEIGNIEPVIIKEVKQIKLETNLTLLTNTQTDNCFRIGFYSTLDDESFIMIYQDSSNSGGENFWCSCMVEGIETREEITITAETDTKISIVASEGKAKFYKNDILIKTIKTNIPKEKPLVPFIEYSSGFDYVEIDYMRTKIIITGDAF